MTSLNKIMLFDREEAESIAERDLTDEEWLMIRSEITTDDTMWQVIDECIKNTVDEVING
jgi:hypothetical protein